MFSRITFFLFAAMLAPSVAFTAQSVSKPFATATSATSTALQSSMPAMSESEAQYLMAKARECAFSDECSVEESREHLHDVLNIQVACASGAVNAEAVCDDQQSVAEIVSNLRENINTHGHGMTSRQQAMIAGSLLPIGFLTLTCASMLLMSTATPDATPFTFQEIMWATRDGYLDDLVSHFVRNGGL